MVAFIFPGQGSQFVGMGKDLCQEYPEAYDIFDKADKALGFSLSKLCFEGPIEELTRTVNCQPAILTTSFAFLLVLKSQVKNLNQPAFCAGLSLGEYSALLAARALDFEDSLKLVRQRAQFMEEEAKNSSGAMAAVLGLERPLVEQAAKEAGAEIANFNCPGQIVVSGEKEAIERIKEIAVNKGAKMVIELEVSGAFHSSLMRPAAERFASLIEGVVFKVPIYPVVSNIYALPENNPDKIRQNLITQIYGSVLWEDSVRFMAAQGVKVFYEIGPGSVLKGLLKKIGPELTTISIGTKEDIDNIVTSNQRTEE